MKNGNTTNLGEAKNSTERLADTGSPAMGFSEGMSDGRNLGNGTSDGGRRDDGTSGGARRDGGKPAVVVEPPSENAITGVNQPSEDASAVESPSMASSGVDAATIEPSDANSPDGISVGDEQGEIDYSNADVAGNGRVRLRGGRNCFVETMNVHGGVDDVDTDDGTGTRMKVHARMKVHDRTNVVNDRNKMSMEVYAKAIARARGVWREVVADLAGRSPTALLARIDAPILAFLL